jgi:hypothetical protein
LCGFCLTESKASSDGAQTGDSLASDPGHTNGRTGTTPTSQQSPLDSLSPSPRRGKDAADADLSSEHKEAFGVEQKGWPDRDTSLEAENLGSYLRQVKISDALVFTTSFDEDEELAQATLMDAERSAAEWEERKSFLYNDEEEDAREAEVKSSAVDVDLDDLFNFNAKTPVPRSATANVTGSGSPLISFTPQNNVPAGFLHQGKEVAAHSPVSAQTAEHDLHKLGQSPFSSPPKMLATKKVTFSPENSLHSYVAHTSAASTDELSGHEVDADNYDSVNSSGASPVNESFTPLRTGLFVQGKHSMDSPMRVADNLTSGACVGTDEEAALAAQISRLRMKAASLSGAQGDTEDGGEGASFESSQHSSSTQSAMKTRPPTGNHNVDKPWKPDFVFAKCQL